MSTQTLSEAYPLASLLYHPGNPGNLRWILEDSLPDETVVRSYSRQWFRFTYEGQHYALRPTDLAVNPYNGMWPVAGTVPQSLMDRLPLFIIGYWHSGGKPSDGQSRHTQESLARLLASDSGATFVGDAVTFQKDSRWVEPALLLVGVTDADAAQMAEKLGQPAYVKVGSKRAESHFVGDHSARRSGGYAWQLSALDREPCPMSLGCETEVAPKRQGGHWGSQAMAVAAMWQAHFALTHQLVGCHPCSGGSSGGRAPEKGRALAMHEILPASRYGFMRFPGSARDQEVLLDIPPGTPSL